MSGSLQDHDIARALRALDHAMPVVRVDTVIAAARARTGAATPARGRVWPGALAFGALSVGAVALAAAVMPTRMRDAIGRLTARAVAPRTTVTAPPLAVRGGVALVPRDSAEVDFQVAQAGGVVWITIGDGQMLTVRGPMHGARYRVSENRVVVANVATGRDSYEIEIPPAAGPVLVRIGSQVAFSIAAGRVAGGAVPDAAGRYVVPLTIGPANADDGGRSDAYRP